MAVKKVKGCSPIISIVVLILFAINSSLPVSCLAQTLPGLSAPGARVSLSANYAPVILKGVKIHPENPLLFDFIVDNGDIGLKGEALTKETTPLVKYFLASLAVPKRDLWVNLSPYEKERMIPEAFSTTEMGHGLLAQDYLLKQITASLIYPESDLGKQFWAKVYSRAQELYGTTQIPINTFNKVWIVPDKATVFQNNNAAFVVESHLKVLLEEDFLALDEGVKKDIDGARQLTDSGPEQVNRFSSQVVREVVIPVLEKEINEGKNFALLRQIYQSLILADWYKQALKISLLGQVYAQTNKVKGIDDVAKGEKLKIYEQYLAAYKDGVYNTIKEEVDPATQTTVPRRYVSGGFSLGETNTVIVTPQTMTPIQNAYMVSSAGDPNTIQYNFQVVFPGAGTQSIGPEEQQEDLGGANDAFMLTIGDANEKGEGHNFNTMIAELETPVEALKILSENYYNEVKDQLNGQPSSLPMKRTMITPSELKPYTGPEKLVVALEVGGSSVKAKLFKTRTDGTVEELEHAESDPYSGQVYTKSQIFLGKIRLVMNKLISQEKFLRLNSGNSDSVDTVVIFAQDMDVLKVNSAVWKHGTKGFESLELVGKQIEEFLGNDFREHDLGHLNIVGIMNDTTATQRGDIAMIDGSSVNFSFTVPEESGFLDAGEIVVNESGYFSKGVEALPFYTDEDRLVMQGVDKKSNRPFAKMVGAKYVEKVLWKKIQELYRRGELFSGKGHEAVPSALTDPEIFGNFSSKLMAEIEEVANSGSGGNLAVKAVLEREAANLGLPQAISEMDAARILKLSEALVKRSACLASLLAAIVRFREDYGARKHHLTINGSAWLHPAKQAAFIKNLQMLLGSNVLITEDESKFRDAEGRAVFIEHRDVLEIAAQRAASLGAPMASSTGAQEQNHDINKDHFFLSEIDDVARLLEMENGREQLIEIFHDSLPMEIFINNLAEAAGVPADVIFQFMEAQRLIIQDSSADYVFSPGAFSNAKIRMFVSVQRFWNSQVREIAQFKNVLRRSVDASRLIAELVRVTGKKYQDVYQAVKGRLILDLVEKDHSVSLEYALQLARKSWDNPDGDPFDLRRNFLVAVSLNDLVNELCRVFAVEQSKVLFELSQLNVWVDNHTASFLSPAIVTVQVRDDNYLTNQLLRPQVMEELIEKLTDEQTRPQWSVQKLEVVVRNVVDKEKLVDLISTRFSMGPQAVKAELVKFHIISADEGGLTNVQKDVFFLSELGEVARDLGILNKLEMLDEDYWGALPSYHWFKEEMARVSGLKREIVEKNLFKAGIIKETNIIEEFTFAQLAFVDVKIAKFNDLQKQSLADKKNIIFPENADQYRASLSLGLESFKRVLRNGVDEILLMGRVMNISRQKYAVVQEVLKKRLLIPDYEKDLAFTLEHSLRVKKSWNQQGDIDTLTLNSYLKAFDGEGFLSGLARAFKRRRSFMIARMLELKMFSISSERDSPQDLFLRQIRGTAGQPVTFVTGHFFETNKILELIDRCVHANDRQEWSLHRYEELINEQVNEAEFIRNLQAAITAPGNSEATIRKELLRVGLRLLIKSNEKSLLAQKYAGPLNVLEKQNQVILQKFAEWTAQKEGKELDQVDILVAIVRLLESANTSPGRALALDYFRRFARISSYASLDQRFRSIHFDEPSDFEQLPPEERLFLRSCLRFRLIQATSASIERSQIDNFMNPRMESLEFETGRDLKAWNELRGGAESRFGIKDSFLFSNELAGAPQSILASPDSISARFNDTKGIANNGKRSVGGIFLGSGQYLRVIEVNPDGQPVFDPKQFEEMKTNLLGIIPVPVSLPVPANIPLLSGITGNDRSPVVGYEFKEKPIDGISPQPATVAARREDQV